MHRTRWISRLTVLVVAGAPASSSAQELVGENALGRVGFSPYWQARLPLEPGDTALAAYVLDGVLYVSTRLGEIHAVDAAVGSPLWARKVADLGRTVRKPAHLTAINGRPAVLVTHAGGVHIFDRATGDQLTEIKGMWAPGSAAAGDATMIYAGSSDGHLYAVRWYDPVYQQPVVLWKLLGQGPVTAAPSLADNLLYFTSQSGKVFACTPDVRKQLVWHFTTEASLEADAVVDSGAVYVAGLDRSLYRLDRETGALKWRFRMPAPLREAPVLAEGTVYQYCQGSGLVAIEADSGKPLWEIPDGLALAARGGNRTCVLLGGDRVAVAESQTGLIVGTLPLVPGVVVPTHRDGVAFYAVSTDGDAACYAPRDVPFLRADQLIRRGPAASQPTTQPATPSAPESEETPPGAETPAGDVNLDDPLRSRSDG